MTVIPLPSPPANERLEHLWEKFKQAQLRAHEKDSTLEDGLEAGRRWKAFLDACVEYDGEI